MSYRCKVCDAVVGVGHPQLRHVVFRKTGPLMGTILRETPVCRRCHDGLTLGVSIRDLLKQRGQPRTVVSPAPLPLKPLPPILTPKPLTLGRPVKLLGKIVSVTK